MNREQRIQARRDRIEWARARGKSARFLILSDKLEALMEDNTQGFVFGVGVTLLAGWWVMSPPAAPASFESSCDGAGGVYDPSAFVIMNGSFIWTQATCITDPAKFESKERFLEPMITARW